MPHHRRLWLPAGLSLTLVGWGANQFASLLAMYRQEYGFSELAVTGMLGIYVAGLVPALLLGGPFSDAAGRKPVALGGIALSVVASAAMLFGTLSPVPLFAGRLLAGIATGMAMAATTSWIKELSQAPWEGHAQIGAGARRASLFSAGGFWLGPVAAGLLANWAPAPATLPYLLHMALCVPMGLVALRLPETRARGERLGLRARLISSSGGHPRFRRVVAPAAPWAFASGTIGFALVPALLTNLGEARLLYTTAAAALTLGAGVLIQPLARRLDDPGSARAVLTALATTAAGLVLALLTGLVLDPRLGLLASLVLGAGYGLMLVSGLLETQRLAPPAELGALTGYYYTLTYLGFLAPTVVALFAQWFPMLSLVGAALLLCLASGAGVARNSRRHLPGAARPA
ncbi:MFS transporter [Zafaria cholistanensis]|uniref:MFS transporter n=1 Tax=Zafaria cholistanensis TaxID=1682741 RepID=A0A5A7NT54_9MICC|nr:MFS transporter [Zafaria cholistanensis]GER22921.1 MFS transporter [Zafaria cholistanensis]